MQEATVPALGPHLADFLLNGRVKVGGDGNRRPGMVRGTVLETMDSGGYTYALLDTGQDQRWVAALQTPVAVGDVVQTDAGMIMTDFTSNTLDRTFDIVYFVGGLQNLSGASEPAPQAAGGMPAGHPDVSGEVAPAATSPTAASTVWSGGTSCALKSCAK